MAFAGAENVERVNSLIYAVVMESRGIYLSPDIEAAKPFAVGLTRFNDQISSVVADWNKSVMPEDVGVFAEFATRVKKFHDFRVELVRRGTEISTASAREWGDNDANRAVRTALTNDLDTLGKTYVNRSQQIYARIERDIWTTALETLVLGTIALTLAISGAFVIHRSIARPLAVVTRVTKEVAGGGAALSVPYGNRRDEIGALARSIAIFQDAMHRNIELNKTVRSDAEARAQQQERISVEISQFGTEIKFEPFRTRTIV